MAGKGIGEVSKMIKGIFSVSLAYIFQMIIAVFITTGLVLVVNSVGPEVEGNLFPVAIAKNVVITGTNDPSKFLISGEMDKLRGNCAFSSLKAYVTLPSGEEVLANIDTGTTIKLRPAGDDFPWGPWVLNVPTWQITGNIRLIIYHRCHPFWVTRTIFYTTYFSDLSLYENKDVSPVTFFQDNETWVTRRKFAEE